MQHQREMGFVLLIVLVFFYLISLLSIEIFSAQTLNLRVENDRFQRIKSLHLAKQLLQKIAEKIVKNGVENCKISLIDPEKLMQKNITWWQQNGCPTNSKIKKYYIIEWLMMDSCSYISSINEPLMPIFIAFHYIFRQIFLLLHTSFYKQP